MLQLVVSLNVVAFVLSSKNMSQCCSCYAVSVRLNDAVSSVFLLLAVPIELLQCSACLYLNI
jgi:hypothetical protein